MKRIFALTCAALLMTLAACGRAKPGPEEPTEVPTQAIAYGWEIQLTVEAPRDGILFWFSRPVFAGSSPLVETANQVYDKMEADYKDKMNTGEANLTEDPWNYTELSELSYEADGIFSFVTKGDWFMGGVHNSWITGHTFDFNLGRELKIADFLRGDDEEIRLALVHAFKGEIGDMDVPGYDYPDAWEQSGPDANFYLADDGLHVFYMPYVVPATQDGVDVLIPWASYLMKREYNPPEVTTQPVEEITTSPDTLTSTTLEPESTSQPETTTGKLPQTREELVAYFNRVSNAVKTDKPGFTWTQQTFVSNIASSSAFIDAAVPMAMRFVPLEVLEMPPAAKGSSNHDVEFNVRLQPWSSRLSTSMVSSAKLTDKGSAWELRVDLKPEKRAELPKVESDHDHGKVFTVMTHSTIHDVIGPYSWLAVMESFAPSYHSSWAILTIDKETDRLIKAEYMLTYDVAAGVKFAIFPAFDATATISMHEVYKIG